MSWKDPLKYNSEDRLKSDTLIQKHKTIYHLLAPHQRQLYNLVFNNKVIECGLYCSRKVGKTALLMLIAHEFAWRNPQTIIRLVMSDQTQAKKTIEPMFNTFIKKLIPSNMLPVYNKSDQYFTFSNGSVLYVNGANPDAIDRAVGTSCNLFLFDEIAMWEGDVNYALKDIFFPQGTLTRAQRIYACTPPSRVDSYFIQNILPKLISNDRLISITIDESPFLTKEDILQLEENMGGRESPEFQRQYLCKLIPKNDSRLTPEFDYNIHVCTTPFGKYAEFGDSKITQTYQYFIVADTGSVDNTAILTGYYDHIDQVLKIEREFIAQHLNPTEIASRYWGERDLIKDSYNLTEGIITVIDAWPGEQKDYREVHGISFRHPIKGKVESNIGHLRDALINKKVLISDKCVRLIWELTNCIWKESTSENKQIGRSAEQKHGDAVMALTYMLRAVNWRFKPDNIHDKPLDLRQRSHYVPERKRDKQESATRVWGNNIHRKHL
jgi:hypothetical protein